MWNAFSLNYCFSFLCTILIKPEEPLPQRTKVTVTLAHFIKTHWSGYVFWCSAIAQSWIGSCSVNLTVFLDKTPKNYIEKTFMLFPSPVNTGVWSSTPEAVTAEQSALRSGLQQICMFSIASECFMCSLFSWMNISSYAFPVNTLQLKDDTTALSCSYRVYLWLCPDPIWDQVLLLHAVLVSQPCSLLRRDLQIQGLSCLLYVSSECKCAQSTSILF